MDTDQDWKALGNPTRWKIINRLRMGPKSVAQIAQAIKVSRPAVSQGLKILLAARLVRQDFWGRQTFYILNTQSLEILRIELQRRAQVAEEYGKRKPGS